MDLRVAITGHVDHGKSTLIGRLMHDTGSLADGKAEEIIASSARRGMATEWAFAVDASQEERDQAITIDTTRVWLQYQGRRIVIIDTPGHREFIRNMMSGAADADAGILVVDALEGIRDQTYRHAYLLQLLDVPEIVVVVNKIDAVADPRARFEEIERDIRAVIEGGGKTVRAVIPISARDGDNVVHRSERTAWYDGPTVIDVLTTLEAGAPPQDQELRIHIADVYRWDDERISVGDVAAGTVAAGDTVVISPSGARTRVLAVKRWPADERPAVAGEAIGLTFVDPVFVDRGDVITLASGVQPVSASTFSGVYFWLSAEPPAVGETLLAKIGRADVTVTVTAVEDAIDLSILDHVAPDPSAKHAAFALELRATRAIASDAGARSVLLRGGLVVAGGKLSRVGSATSERNNVVQQHLIPTSDRSQRNGYRGIVAWFTGLPCSGKSTIAKAVERELFARGYFVYVLDGDNIRSGINSDLSFSREDRDENIRRVGQIAALFADAGVVTLVSTISPFANDRARARSAAAPAFTEIYVKASIAACEARDVKGHYRRARAGEIADFTGVSSPYEEPVNPELVVDTESQSLEACVQTVVAHVLSSVRTDVPSARDAITSSAL